jgi:hypothetical protein
MSFPWQLDTKIIGMGKKQLFDLATVILAIKGGILQIQADHGRSNAGQAYILLHS